jgi:hypothetical protein
MLFDIPALFPGAIAVVFGLAALVQMFAVRRRWRARRRVSAAHRSLWTLALSGLALLSAALSTSLSGYQRIIAEAPVATLQVRELGPQHYAVRVDRADGSHDSAVIDGDEWQLDARVIKWTPRAVTLGAQPLYRVERLSGRYRDIEQARTKPATAVALAEDGLVDLWQLKRRYPNWLPWVDADYGSAAYLPLIDGAKYEVTLAAAGGLVARPADPATAALMQQKGW